MDKIFYTSVLVAFIIHTSAEFNVLDLHNEKHPKECEFQGYQCTKDNQLQACADYQLTIVQKCSGATPYCNIGTLNCTSDPPIESPTFDCQDSDTVFPSPDDCSQYYVCYNETHYSAMVCSHNQKYDALTLECVSSDTENYVCASRPNCTSENQTEAVVVNPSFWYICAISNGMLYPEYHKCKYGEFVNEVADCVIPTTSTELPDITLSTTTDGDTPDSGISSTTTTTDDDMPDSGNSSTTTATLSTTTDGDIPDSENSTSTTTTGSSTQKQTTTTTTESTPTTSTAPANSTDLYCGDFSALPDPMCCMAYFTCTDKKITERKTCKSGTYFSEHLHECIPGDCYTTFECNSNGSHIEIHVLSVFITVILITKQYL